MRLRRTSPLSSGPTGDTLAGQCRSELALIVERRRATRPSSIDRAARD